MKITIKKHQHDIVFNYYALKKIQELTGKKIFEFSELNELDSSPILLASSLFGAAKTKDKTIEDLPFSVSECEDLINEDLSIFNAILSEFSKSLLNAFQEKNEQGTMTKSPKK